MSSTDFDAAFNVFPVIHTERLLLTQILPSDAEAYCLQLQSALDAPSRAPWGIGAETQTAESAQTVIGYASDAWKRKVSLPFALRLKENQAECSELIGFCAMFSIERRFKAEIGYWLGMEHQNKGLMTEAVAAVVEHAFGKMGLGRIFAQTSTRNHASIFMLKKVGFRHKGTLRKNSYRDGEWDDTAIMGTLATDVGFVS